MCKFFLRTAASVWPGARRLNELPMSVVQDVYNVLKQKELQMEQLQREIEALRLAALLLEDSKEGDGDGAQSAPANSDDGKSAGDRQSPAARITPKQFP